MQILENNTRGRFRCVFERRCVLIYAYAITPLYTFDDLLLRYIVVLGEPAG